MMMMSGSDKICYHFNMVVRGKDSETFDPILLLPEFNAIQLNDEFQFKHTEHFSFI